MRYNLFDGGNFLRRPEDQLFSGYSETYDVEPAIHHKKRDQQIEQHWDSQGRAWRGNYEGLGEKGAQIANITTNDELVSHLIGAGWWLKAVAYHVKRAGSGTLTPKVELLAYDENGNRVDNVQYGVVDPTGADLVIDLSKPGFYVGLVPMPAATAATTGTAATATDTGAAGDGVASVNVTLTVADFTVGEETISGLQATGTVNIPLGAAAEGAGLAAPVPLLTQTNGYLLNKVTLVKNDDEENIPLDMCVGIYLDLTNYYDENPCDCAPTPCETNYPDPLCMPL